MKKVLRKSWIVVLLILTAFLFGENALAQDINKVVGSWAYEVPDAPYGYQKGTIIIKADDNNLKGDVEFTDGYKIKLKTIEFDGKKMVLGLYVDYEYIKAEVELSKNVLKGHVNTPEGRLKLVAERNK